jgi:amino acid adenylation domain-containing protein
MAIEGFRVSPQQQHLWSLQQPDQSAVYRSHCAVLIEGKVEISILETAVREVWKRHEILHTAFHCSPGTDSPVQVITDGDGLSINSYNLSRCDSLQQEARLEALYRELSQLPFDYDHGRLSQVSLVALSPATNLLLVNLSSLCADHASLRNVVRDLSLVYAARLNCEQMDDPAAQYADLAEWQNELLESEDAKAGNDYWRGQDFNAFDTVKLPGEIQSFDRKRGFQPRAIASTIDATSSAKIAKLASEYDTSSSVFLMACWQILLWHLSAESDFIVGMACDGRNYEGLQETVGPFAKYLPLRCHLEGQLQFGEILRRVDEAAREILEWQEYFSWEHLARTNGNRNATPFFAASFEFHEPPAKYSAAGLTFTIRTQQSCIDRFKLKLSCVQSEGLLSAQVHYDSNLFRAADIRRLNEQFRTLLESAVANPEAAINELEILSEPQRRQLVAEFNDTTTDAANDKSIHRLFEEQVERTPLGVAVAFEQQRLTYAELNARANQLAHHLRTAGVGPGVLVAICLERSLEMVVGLLGVLKAGGAYVPIDPFSPAERLAFMLKEVGAPVVLTQQRVLGRIPEGVGAILCLDSAWDAVALNSDANPSITATVGDAAYVIYTSGSTGQPKGVIVEHSGLSNTVNWIIKTLDLSPGDSCFLKTPITFDAAGRELFPTLLAGATLIIAEPGRQGDCRYLAETMRSEGISILHCVPSLLRLLVEESAFDDGLKLRAVMCGGEALPVQLVTRFQHRSKAKLYNVYGPTEASIDTTYWLCEGVTADSSIPIGRPIPNSTIYILDDLLRPVPIGAAGELHIGGIGLARGYLNRAELTAEKFIPNPFSSEVGARLYKSGDLARFQADGNIEYLGRIDHQVKIRGFRIELEEIEAVLRGHPAVREAAVMAQEDPSGERRLVAYLVTDQERPATTNDLRIFLQEKLPEYMVPADFMTLDALPLMPNGKVDRRALPISDRRLAETDRPFVSSRSPTEELVVQIWSQILNLERIGIHDNFFHLGGHSLLATQVVSRLREAFQVDLPLRRIFELPTVAGLAESIELTRQAGNKLAAPPILPVPRDGDLPLSFAQQRLWFIDQLDPGNSVYNFPAAVRLIGPLDLTALEQSLNEIVRRHEVLRTTFLTVDGRPAQVIAQTSAVTLALVDLRALSEADRETEVQRLAISEARCPFDLTKGPLLRASLLQLGEQEYVGLLTMHHIVADGWSSGVLIREMAVLYQAFSSGKSSPLIDLPIQYADFAHWQRQWLRDEVLEVQLDYWKRQLSGAAQLELATDHPRPPMQTFHGARQTFALPGNVTARLKTLSRQQGVTSFMALVAAFKVLMHRYTGQDDIVVGTPIANRNRLEVESLIGFFANTLALRTDLSGNPTFIELLRRVREVCLGAYVHQDLPFERLVEELHLERDLSRNPIFQVMFVLRNASGQVLEMPGLTMSPLEVDSGTTHFDLILHMNETEQELSGELVYNTDLFEPDTIARMLEHFQTLLEGVVADPAQRLLNLPLLSAAERHQLVVEWNDNKVGHPPTQCVHQLFEAQVERTPDAIAVVFEGEQLTYGELNRRANQLAHHLRSLGVGPEVPVGIRMEHSLEVIVGLLGILKAGGAYLPLDPAYPKERTAFMIEDAQIPVLLVQERLMDGLPRHAAKVVSLDSDWKIIATESVENPVDSAIFESLAYVIYTSGSSGQPKGVLVSHGSIVNHCRDIARYYELVASDRILQFASLSFDLSLEQILPTLLVGATLVLQAPKVWPIAEFNHVLAKSGLTVLNLPTAYWQELTREWADLPEVVPNHRPRLVIVGGDVMSPEALGRWQRTPLRAVRLINAYGPTEATITASAFEITPQLGPAKTFQNVPIGRPLTNREIYILDRYGNPVPIGVAGELYIGGGLARGYLNRPELTAEKFIPNWFSGESGARLYKSGDLARYQADGNIEYLGRVDHQVKIRGFRVELEEIEAVLRAHPAVGEAVLVALEDPAGERRLVAYLVAEREHPATTKDLRIYLKGKVPEYMVPADFVTLDALPMMPNGKVDRRALPAPDRTRPDSDKAFVAPRDALELQLTQLWEEVLGIRPVGIRDNFFELGGHSLAAVRLFALIERRLGKKLPLATVFQGATIEHLADILRDHDKPTRRSSSLVPIQTGGNKRPLFLMHPAGGHVFPYVHLVHGLGTDQPCYGLQAKGLEEGQEPHTRIEDMAAHYIDALQTVQPKGPYCLGGWSAGGVVAFEMAQQLHAQGHRIALLALLDARIPTSEEDFADKDFEANLLADFIRYFGLSLDPRESLAALPKDELLSSVLEQAKRAGLVPLDIEVSQAHPFIELCKADFRATRNYVLRPYPGRITLFKASQELGGISLDPTLGWSKWATRGVEVHVVPGNHASMVYKPHVEVLAEKMKTCLNQAQSAVEHSIRAKAPGRRSMKVAQ